MTIFRLTTLLIAVLACAAALASTGTNAQPVAGTVDFIAVDTDVSGNSPNSIGSADVCSSIEVGEEIDIDVVISGVPEVREDGGGLTGAQFTILYDERYVEVIRNDIEGQMLGAAAGSSLVDFSDPVPNDGGLFRVALADFGVDSDESGDGVLARITLRGIDQGTSNLIFVEETILYDSTSVASYTVDSMQNGMVTVGVDCAPNVTPPPVPAELPSRTLAPPDQNGETPGPDDSPTDGESPGPDDDESPSPGDDDESPSPGATNGNGDDSNGDEEDDDSSGTAILIAAAVTAVLLAAAGIGFLVLRRRGEAAP